MQLTQKKDKESDQYTYIVSAMLCIGINTKSENDDRRNGFLAWFVPCDRCLLFLATDVCNMSDDNSDV